MNRTLLLYKRVNIGNILCGGRTVHLHTAIAKRSFASLIPERDRSSDRRLSDEISHIQRLALLIRFNQSVQQYVNDWRVRACRIESAAG